MWAGYAASLEETFEGLEANGEQKALTEANKHEFVRLSIQVLLWDQCSEALKSIRTGYVSMCACVFVRVIDLTNTNKHNFVRLSI